MSKPFYITTSIAYVNGAPHLGFAMELLEADAIARYQRLIGNDVKFLTGTDEHGSKIAETAAKEGITPMELCDRNSAEFRRLTTALNVTSDDFIRTTDQKRHWPAVVKLWNTLVKKGDIEKRAYEGLYCVGCERFILEKELIDGKCPIHGTEPRKLKEENYFFKLSKYSKQIEKLLTSGELAIVPEFRALEIINIVKEGLTDVSFSRPKKVLNWGVPVPDDETQVMYVWCDALTNYISALGYAEDSDDFKKYWPHCTHVIGKDIVRFHAAVWIGMLLSAGLPLPQKEFVHGWINMKGERMSKSKGNVISPFELVEKYGVDAVRYYVLSEIPTGQDGDFTYERFEEKYNSDLANKLGNLVSRVTAMLEKYCGGVIPAYDHAEIDPETRKIDTEYCSAMDKYLLEIAIKETFKLVEFANKYVDDMAPWTLAKEGKQAELENVLGNLCRMIALIAVQIHPFLPAASDQIIGLFDGGSVSEYSDWAKLATPKRTVKKASPLFAKLP